jgi:transposase
VPSRWRHLDVGVWPLELAATLRQLRCPDHGVVTEAVPFARPGANLTRDLDDLIAWLATRMDKTAIARLCRVSWRTVGRVCERVAASELDPVRLDGLFRIGVDEISWRKHHKYLTLVVDHDGGKVVWGAAGHNAKTLDEFFNERGPERAALIEAVSMDLGGAYLKSVAGNLGDDVLICADIFDLVALATTALDQVRRPYGKNYATSTRTRLRSSRAPDGRWSRTPKTSPTAKP